MTGLESKEGGPGDGTCQRMGTDPLGARPRNCDSEPGGGGRGCCQRAGSLYPGAHAAYPGGAGEGNRTPVSSLGSSRSAIEPRPLGATRPVTGLDRAVYRGLGAPASTPIRASGCGRPVSVPAPMQDQVAG